MSSALAAQLASTQRAAITISMPTQEPEWIPGKLHHGIPSWVEPGSFFHIRVRVAYSSTGALREPCVARPLLEVAEKYHERRIWYCRMILLMPDHLHTILAFEHSHSMSEVMRTFKRGASRCQHIEWQDGFFDHRIRDLKELEKTEAYIRRNPVAKGLCAASEDWPWVWVSNDTIVAW